MRCKACNAVLEPWEIIFREEQGVFEDLCTSCLTKVRETCDEEDYTEYVEIPECEECTHDS